MGLPKENEKHSRENQYPSHFLIYLLAVTLTSLLPAYGVHQERIQGPSFLSRVRQFPDHFSWVPCLGHQNHRLPCPHETPVGVAGASLLPWLPLTQLPANLGVIHAAGWKTCTLSWPAKILHKPLCLTAVHPIHQPPRMNRPPKPELL